jgi:ABC-type lipoprotein release transport system permease subunit
MRETAFATLIRQSWRSLWRSWRRTLITVSAIVMGLTIAVFFVALGQGFYTHMVNTAVRAMGGHITLEHSDYREAPAVDLAIDLNALRETIIGNPAVAQHKALVLGQGVVKSARATGPGLIMGVEPARESTFSELGQSMTAGEYLAPGDKRKIVIGQSLADQLKIKVGKKLVLASNNVEGELSEQQFRVKGIFETGSPELDAYMVQIPMDQAQRLFGLKPGQVTQLAVMVKDLGERDETLEALRKFTVDGGHDKVAVLPWESVQTELASFIQIDRSSNWVMQSILIFLTLFTIWNTVLMSVLERRREFAMMLAIGTPVGRIRAQVLIESTFVALVGSVIGLGLGGGLALYLGEVGLDIFSSIEGGMNVAGFGLKGRVYPHLEPNMLAWFGGIIMISTMFMSIFASRGVRRIVVTDVLR